MALRCFEVMKSFRDLFLTVCIDILRQLSRAHWRVNRVKTDAGYLNRRQHIPATTNGLLNADTTGMSV